jgi:hypothetical protein
MNCIKCDTELQQNYKISYCVSVILHAINILHSLSKHQLGKDIVTKFKSTVTESRDTMKMSTSCICDQCYATNNK